MIVHCPSCSQRYQLPAAQLHDDPIIRCSHCGQSWMEATTIEAEPVMSEETLPALLPAVIPAGRQTPALVEHNEAEISKEIKALADAVRQADETRETERLHRRRRIRNWMALAASILLPVAAAAAAPNIVAKYAPGTAPIYRMAGFDLNTSGFEIKDIVNQRLEVDDVPVLAIRGTIENISFFDRQAPALKFVLKNAEGDEVHHWTLAGVKAQRMEPGETSPFVTRLANPPAKAEAIEVSFVTSTGSIN